MKSISKNAIYNTLQTFVPAVAWIVVIPVTLHELGSATFGAWAIMQALVGYMGVLDLGVGPTVIRLTADAVGQDSPEIARRGNSAALVLYTGLGGVGALIVFVALPLFMHNVQGLPAGVETQLASITWVLALQILFSIPCSVYPSIMRGLQRYDVYAVQRIVGAIVNCGLILVVLPRGAGLLGVVAAGAVSTMVSFVGSGIWVWFAARSVFPGVSGFGWHDLKSVTSFSLKVFVLQVSGILVFNSTKLILGTVASLDVVAVYDVASRAFDYLRTLATALTDALVPAASSLRASGQLNRLDQLFLKGSQSMLALSCVITAPIFVAAPQITTAWVGTVGIEAGLVLRILLVGFAAYCLTRVPMTVLIGVGQIDFYVSARAASAVAIPALVWIGAVTFGLGGAASAMSAGSVAVDVFLFLYGLRLFALDIRSVVGPDIGLMISAVLAAIAVLSTASLVPTATPPLGSAGVLMVYWGVVFVSLMLVGAYLRVWPMPASVRLGIGLLRDADRRRFRGSPLD